MAINAEAILTLVEAELASVSDRRVVDHIRSLIVPPRVVMRRWDYGEPGTRYPCWSVLEHAPSESGIAFCESGFGPSSPWGLVSLSESPDERSIGVDYAWYPIFLDAYFESMACTELPIWRVFKGGYSGNPGDPMTEESDWDSTWRRVYELREADDSTNYDCDHSIEYKHRDT